MALIFRIERTKKIPRITVLRERKQGVKRKLPELLGSFNSQKPFDHITSKLLAPELYEFYNFIGTLEFGEQYFDLQADELDRFMFKAPLQLKEAFYKIWDESKKYGIEFLPDKEMLLSVFKRGKQIEQQLKVLTNGEFSALSDQHHYDLSETHLPSVNSLRENQMIMRAVIENDLSVDKLVERFNEIASKLDKRPKFNKEYFEIIENKFINGGKETFPKWHYAIAIELLLDLKSNVINIISPALVARYWLSLNKQKTFEATLKKFDTAFKTFSNSHLCHNFIKKSFIEDELRYMGRLSQNSTPDVVVAVKKWLTSLKKSNSKLTFEMAVGELKRNYPLLKDNKYVQKLIKTEFI